MTRRTVTARGNLVSIAVAAEHLAVSPNTVRRRIADGTLQGYRMGPKMIRVDLDELDGLLKPIGSRAA